MNEFQIPLRRIVSEMPEVGIVILGAVFAIKIKTMIGLGANERTVITLERFQLAICVLDETHAATLCADNDGFTAGCDDDPRIVVMRPTVAQNARRLAAQAGVGAVEIERHTTPGYRNVVAAERQSTVEHVHAFH